MGFAFNAQGQEIWRRDQAGGIIETTFDVSGRQTARSVTTLASGFDGAVRRIETAYDSLGRTETVTQFDAASAGNVVDQVKNVFDGWGNLTNFRQDLDSTVGGSGYWEVAYTYAKATDGRNTVRRTGVTLPGGASYGFNYRGGVSHDSEASRVSSITDAFATDLAAYEYIGAGQVVRTTLDEVGIFSKAYTGSGTTFGRLDRFNRTTISSWTRDLATDRDVYKVTLGYDRNSNITSQDDAVHTGHDVAYANDGLNRLVDADEGTLSGGSIGSRTRRQQWALNQTGNWSRDKVDLNGDGDYLDAGELDDTRTHNDVNELTARDTNTSSPAEHSFSYDAPGNMTDDGVHKYEWDAFYRLRRVKNQSNALVSEYWYNGLGFLVTRHQDTDSDGDVDGSDVKFHTAFDERWRQVATFRGSDSSPKENFVYHCAGSGGWGGSSYIDSVLLRDRDMTNGWAGSADGTLEERTYLLQNWRADVVAIVEPDGDGGATMVEWIKYSAYGVPFALPAGDTDSDGDCDSTDDAQVTTWKNAPAYDVRGDLDLDGDVDATDESLVAGAHQSLGRGVLTGASVGNRKGYAGYEGDAKLSAKWHVRHRVLDSVLGRWLRRDSLGYRDGAGLAQYAQSSVLRLIDPSGMLATGPSCPGDISFSPDPPVNGWGLHGTVWVVQHGRCVGGAGVVKCKFAIHIGVAMEGARGRMRPMHKKDLDNEDLADAHDGWHNPGSDPDLEWCDSEGGTNDNGCSTNWAPDSVCTGAPGNPGEVNSQLRGHRSLACGRTVESRITATSALPVPAISMGAVNPNIPPATITVGGILKMSCGPCSTSVGSGGSSAGGVPGPVSPGPSGPGGPGGSPFGTPTGPRSPRGDTAPKGPGGSGGGPSSPSGSW